MPVGLIDEPILVDEYSEEGEGRKWNDHGSEFVGWEWKKDGVVSTLSA